MKRILLLCLTLLAALGLTLPASADAIVGPVLILYGLVYYWPVVLLVVAVVVVTILLLRKYRKKK